MLFIDEKWPDAFAYLATFYREGAMVRPPPTVIMVDQGRCGE
jgi:hypothetical protein